MSKVASIIVFYNPTAKDIAYATALSRQWEGVIVDNSASPCLPTGSIGKMAYICNGENLGIAEAQNIGIRHLSANSGLEYIVFFDQDSRIPMDYLEGMAEEFKTIKNHVGNLALLGPTVVRKDDGEEYKSAVHHYTTDNNGFSPRSHIISSGSCVSVEALRTVGLMDESLFIDYVDFEWCWRALSKGHAIGITSHMTLNHKVGQKELSLGKHKVIISSPTRYFYQYRNFLWLLRRGYVPLQWKLATGVKFSLRLLYLPLVLTNGSKYLQNMLKGVGQGLRNCPTTRNKSNKKQT